MNIQEFETEYRDALDEANNQLQTAVLLVAQVEVSIASIGQALQNLSQSVEEFVSEQSSE